MNGREEALNFDIGVKYPVCYRDTSSPDVTNGYLRLLERIEKIRLVGEICDFDRLDLFQILWLV